MAGLPRLHALDLTWTELEGDGLRRLGSLAGLTELRLGGKRLNRAAFGHLARLGRLRILDLSETGMTEKEAAALAGLKRLRELNLSGNPINDSGLRALHGLTELRELTLFGTRVSARGLAEARRALPRATILPITLEVDSDALLHPP